MNPRFASYLVVAGLADAGFWIALVAQGWLVLTLTGSPLWLGLVAGAAEAPALMFALAGGEIADRFDRRAAVVALNAVLLVLALVTAGLIATGRISVGLLAALAFGLGTAVAVEHPIDRAYLFDLLEGADVERGIALSSTEFALARLAGPALGGLAIAVAGVASGYALYALAVVPAIVFSATALARGFGARRDAGGDAPGSLADALAYLRRERSILALCALVAAFTILVSPYVALLPAIARDVLHLDERGYGALQAAGGAGAVLGSLALAFGPEPRRKGHVLAAIAAGGGLLLVLFTTLRSAWPAGGALVALGAVDAGMYALANTALQERVEPRYRGRANALFTVAFLGGIPVGNVVLGAVAQRTGPEWALCGSGALLATIAAATLFHFVRAGATARGYAGRTDPVP